MGENTIISFVGDHGYHLGEMGGWAKNTPYEYSARVPTILRVPGQMKEKYGGFKEDAIVEMLDLFPTLIDAARLEENTANAGKSLMKYIRGEKIIEKEKDSNVALTSTYNVWHSPNRVNAFTPYCSRHC